MCRRLARQSHPCKLRSLGSKPKAPVLLDAKPLPPSPASLRPEIESPETSKIAEIFTLDFALADLTALWVGEGDLPTPDFISDAAIASLKAGDTFYTAKRGIPALRQAISGSVSQAQASAFRRRWSGSIRSLPEVLVHRGNPLETLMKSLMRPMRFAHAVSVNRTMVSRPVRP